MFQDNLPSLFRTLFADPTELRSAKHQELENHEQTAEALVFYPLVNCYIAIENGPFIVDLPAENGDFP